MLAIVGSLDYTIEMNHDHHQKCLQLTAVDNGGLDGRADSTGARAERLDLLDDLEGGIVGNLAEDDVLAIEPRGHNGGDEELGAVAADC